MSQATENCEQPVGESQVTSSEQMVIAIQYGLYANVSYAYRLGTCRSVYDTDHITKYAYEPAYILNDPDP